VPEITLLGWFHTAVAVLALITGFLSLVAHKVISEEHGPAGRIYLICTLVAAVTALMIYQHGGFGPGHFLAVLTLLALAGGFLATRIVLIKSFAIYFKTFCYSATLLFHMIPAITDGLLRLPAGNPVLTDPQDPMLAKFYLAFLLIFLIGVVMQMRWLRGQEESAD
jgi:uncharacterized membrane protein